MVLETIRGLWSEQDYDGVIKAIKTVETTNLDLEDRLKLQYIRGFSLLQLNEQDEVGQLLSLYVTDEPNPTFGQAQLRFLKGTWEYVKGEFVTAIETLNNLASQIQVPGEEMEDLLGDVLNRLATSYTSIGDYEKSIEVGLESLEIREKLGVSKKIGPTMYNLGTTFFQAGKLDEASQYLEGTQRIFESEGNLLGKAYCKMELGGIYQYQGRLKAALDNFLEAHGLYKQYGSERQVAWSLTDLGNIYQKMGDIKRSLEYYQSAVPLYQKMDDPRIFGNHLRAMAISYRFQGDFEKAVELNSKALELYQSIDNKPFQGRALYQLGGDYFEQGRLDFAVEFYTKAKEIFQEVENQDYLARALFDLSQVKLEFGDRKTVIQYRDQLEQIRDHSSSELIDQLYRLLSYQLDLNENRIKSKAQGIIGLEKIVEEPVRDIRYTTLAFLQLVQQLVIEFGSTKNKEILRELNSLIPRGYQMATEQNSPQLRIKVLLLDSQIHLIQLKFDDAVTFLDEAVILARQQGLDSLATLSQELQLDLKRRSKELQELIGSDRIDDILHETGLVEFIGNLTKNRFTIGFQLDQPIYFSIISQGGLPILSRYYTSVNFDEHLVGGFITAISNFADETFQGENILSEISIGGTQLMLEQFGETRLCYLYSGSTIAANERLGRLLLEWEQDNSIARLIEETLKQSETIYQDEVIEKIDHYFEH